RVRVEPEGIDELPRRVHDRVAVRLSNDLFSHAFPASFAAPILAPPADILLNEEGRDGVGPPPRPPPSCLGTLGQPPASRRINYCASANATPIRARARRHPRPQAPRAGSPPPSAPCRGPSGHGR